MDFLVLGAGRQGTAIIYDLLAHGFESIRVVDRDPAALQTLQQRFAAVSTSTVDFNELGYIAPLMKDADVCISAAPYFYNFVLAQTAVQNTCHFCDLGGNTQIVLKELRLDAEAREAGVVVIPDCGLSPGLTNILAARAISSLDRVDSVEIRVGALPFNPTPPLNYQNVSSVVGLLNEYMQPAVVGENGAFNRVESLTGIEPITFDGYTGLEAFYTHGGISTLPETYAGRIPNLSHKTVRYSGHAETMRNILKDPQFKTRGHIAAYLESTLPTEGPDIVLVRVSAIGSGRVDLELIDVADSDTGLSAMMRTSGFSAAIVAEMIAAGRFTPGAHVLEKVVPADEFLDELSKRGIEVKRGET